MNFQNITWKQGCELVGWSLIGLVCALGVYELAVVFI